MQLMSRDTLINDRDELTKRIAGMKQEYGTFEAHYKELSEYFDPRRGRFFVEDRNKGDKRYKNIINNAGGRALRVSVAGLHAGVMSPSRPWFTFTLLDTDLLQSERVKTWMELFRDIILLIFSKSNLYNMSPLMLRELLLFGTGCLTHVDDFEDVARFYAHTVGSYMIAQDERLNVNTLVREFQMTAVNMIKKFGLENCSQSVRNAYDNGNYHTWHTVCHVIEQNPHAKANGIFAEFKPYRSVYFEQKSKDKAVFLRRSGFDEFPGYCPRWVTTGEDIYATDCPGMMTLADVKMLQTQEKELALAIEKSGSPPLQGPPAFRNQPFSNLPGSYMSVKGTGAGNKIESIYTVDPKVQEQSFNIERTEKRIREGFFTDLFMAITDMEGVQPKNQLQLSQINEERLLQIGPALEQVHGEWLDRMVRRTAKQVIDAGIMPKAPPELQGKELELEFVSALAQAQKSVATSAIERTVGFAGSMAQIGFTQALDKIDADVAIERYADLVGAPAKLIVPDEEAMQVREARKEELQRAQQLEMANQAAGVMKQAADSKLDNNVLAAVSGRA